MSTRLSIITGSMFGGVMLAGAFVANPGLVSSLSPGNFLHVSHDQERNEDSESPNPGVVDVQASDRQISTGQGIDPNRPRREDRDHGDSPSSILVNASGQGSSREHEDDDDD